MKLRITKPSVNRQDTRWRVYWIAREGSDDGILSWHIRTRYFGYWKRAVDYALFLSMNNEIADWELDQKGCYVCSFVLSGQ